jgi:hypothetical protein
LVPVGGAVSDPSDAGSKEVLEEIKADTFGNAYRGSSPETVLDSIAEQRQVFISRITGPITTSNRRRGGLMLVLDVN